MKNLREKYIKGQEETDMFSLVRGGRWRWFVRTRTLELTWFVLTSLPHAPTYNASEQHVIFLFVFVFVFLLTSFTPVTLMSYAQLGSSHKSS